jgi:hypothetical protein
MLDNEKHSWTDVSFSLSQATVIAIVATPIMGVVVLGLYALVWGMDSLLSGTLYFRHLSIVLSVIFASIMVHEGLHWGGYVGFGHLPWGAIRIGFSLRSLAAYVHSDAEVNISAYRRLVALPGVVLGVLPVFAGIVWGAAWMAVYGLLMLIGASGDGAILWKIRSVAPGSLVVDHPSRAGCLVLKERREGIAQSPGD